jgi:hypothetical protein
MTYSFDSSVKVVLFLVLMMMMMVIMMMMMMISRRMRRNRKKGMRGFTNPSAFSPRKLNFVGWRQVI